MTREEFIKTINTTIDNLKSKEEEKLISFYDDFSDMMKELKDLGLNPNDFFPENIGLKDGKVACFDCKYKQGGEVEVALELRSLHSGTDFVKRFFPV